MIRKYSVLLLVLTGVVLIVIATRVYPGGSVADINSVGFQWSKNFISNLFAAKALNGADNTSRVWAILGMAFHSVGYGIFFMHMAQKVPQKHPSLVFKLVGFVNIFFSFLIVTPLHDRMVTLSSTLFLIGLFYITVYALKTKQQVLKYSCILCLLIFYYTLFLYGTGNWGLLAIMQKVSFICSMLLVLGIEYFTRKEDFARTKPAGY